MIGLGYKLEAWKGHLWFCFTSVLFSSCEVTEIWYKYFDRVIEIQFEALMTPPEIDMLAEEAELTEEPLGNMVFTEMTFSPAPTVQSMFSLGLRYLQHNPVHVFSHLN